MRTRPFWHDGIESGCWLLVLFCHPAASSERSSIVCRCDFEQILFPFRCPYSMPHNACIFRKLSFFFAFILKTCYNHMENGSNWNHEWRRLAPFSYADCGHGRWWKLLCHVRDAICTPSLLCLILPIGVVYFYLLVSMTSFVVVCCCWCN